MPNLTIPVGGRDFEVVQRKGLKDDDGESVFGLFDSSHDRISICLTKNKTVSEKRATAFHEALHAAFAMSGQSEVLVALCRDADQARAIEESLVIAIENMMWPRAIEVIQRLK